MTIFLLAMSGSGLSQFNRKNPYTGPQLEGLFWLAVGVGLIVYGASRFRRRRVVSEPDGGPMPGALLAARGVVGIATIVCGTLMLMYGIGLLFPAVEMLGKT
jgi:uncharacterized membrane protein YidH (DUF202 family)